MPSPTIWSVDQVAPHPADPFSKLPFPNHCVSVGAVVADVHVSVDAELWLPTESTARTPQICVPSLSGPTLAGLVHGAAALLSRKQRNVAVESESLNENVAFAPEASEVALEMVGAGGAVLSICQLALVCGLELPAASFALTAKECRPWERAEYDVGELQAEAAAPSSEQLKVAVESLSVKTNVALEDVLGSAGRLEITGAAGATVSTVHAALSVPVPPVLDA